jgi:hypothetical protein
MSRPVPFALVVTSIASPNLLLERMASECAARGGRFFLIGDAASPREFHIEHCEFHGLDRQARTGFRTAEVCPQRHYARKNIGYLLAMQAGARLILETDDDNLPLPGFWLPRARQCAVPALEAAGWANVLAYFTDANIWPRGLPLDAIRAPLPAFESLAAREADCPIQQALVDGDPDVDAIYRLILPLPADFATGRAVALGRGSWCPFNSQNTAWWSDAFPLLYLPGCCAMRLTDIWRSFVAQRIAWENGWSILHHSATARQQRNEHCLMKDFEAEVPGYLHNRRIAATLEALPLAPGTARIPDNLRACYEALVRAGIVDARELPLLEAWLADVAAIPRPGV